MQQLRLLTLLWALLPVVLGEFVQLLRVEEGVPPGSVIGTIGEEGQPGLPQPPFDLIIPHGPAEADLSVDQRTGVIRTRGDIDREKVNQYRIGAIVRGESIQVVIKVDDVNDNTPAFPSPEVEIDIPENTPKGTRRKLTPAQDADLDRFGTQSYQIVSGNDDGVFLLSGSNVQDKKDLELIVNDNVDREQVEK